MLVEASQSRVAKRKMVMDNSPEPDVAPTADTDPANGGVDIDNDSRQFEDDEEALREVSTGDDDDDEVMHAFATQSQIVRPTQADRATDGEDGSDDNDNDDLREVGATPAPPVFEPVRFDMEGYLSAAVKKRMRKGYEAVLEEQPKWSLVAKVLKEIEDTIARVAQSHAGEWSSSWAGALLTFRCAWYQYCPDHVRFRSYLPTATAIPHLDEKDRPSVWCTSREKDDGDALFKQLAA